ncbi:MULTISPECIES: DUF5036 family protein [Odoribacteraceae]|jgi:hypothetical protein|uniref:DUF5036 family protein n=1 Tax=Culturomica massiliensis TaxID=1841857 RepID=UPI00033E8B3E|nr:MULTISPECIES: DUF5036 family protein [Odoribacteraceae]RHV91651.1 DUF5036 domain-containing protein [Odoribacter sp. OF09-27XD]CCZ09249.1 putative uncharacterized protein [Odoribacter sp. CAG:788]
MKMYRFMWLMAMLVVSAAFVACSKDGDGDPDDPGSKVPDPEGTMVLNMRNENNGGTYLRIENWPEIWINHSDNFESYADRIEFVSLGKMKGLGNVTKIPETGWQSSVAVKPAYGYVAKWGNRYCRLYVVQELLAAGTNGVIGAEVKYQYPFEPTKLEVSPDSLLFPREGGNLTVVVSTDADSWNYTIITNLVPWLKISQEKNQLKVSVEENESVNVREAFIGINANEKQEYLWVIQERDGRQTQAPYKIGDFYNENGVVGMVYKINDSGMHGMITSLKNTSTVWAVSGTLTNALDQNDGMNNTDVIKQLTDWESRYPAFKWCDDLNRNGVSGWYLPSINELKELYAGFCGLDEYPGYEAEASVRYGEARYNFEATLRKKGGYGMLNTVIEPYVPSLIYMSSTEINSSYFNGVRFYDGLVTNGNKTDNSYKYYIIRAVRPF